MKKRILKTLNAYLETNREVLSEGEIKDIEEQIRFIENYKSSFATKFKNKYGYMK